MKSPRLAIALTACTAALALAPGTADAAASPASCPSGGLYAPLVQPVTAHRANTKSDLFQPIRNTRASAIRGATYALVIDSKGLWRSVPPTIWWRVDKGSWRLVHFTWRAGAGHADPVWSDEDLPLGNFAAHQTHTLELSYSFAAKAHTGWYTGWAEMNTGACTDFATGMDIAAVIAVYQP